MPPRKKTADTAAAAASADGAVPVTAAADDDGPRRSGRAKKAPAAPAPAPAAKAPSKAKSKAAPKRARADDDDDAADDNAGATAPAAKKAKKGKGKKKADADDDDGDDAQADDDDDDKGESKQADAPKKMVSVMMRGAAPVDPESRMEHTHQVLTAQGEVWDAMLNQTDVVKNANKFYVLQLLHPIGNDNQCTLFTRWGRVGEPGQQQKKGPFGIPQAIIAFKAQFKAKAAANWDDRRAMVRKSGKYMWLERSFEEEKEESGSSSKQKTGDVKDEDEEIIPDSTLPNELQAFCRLIFSSSIIEATLTSMNYDANKLPLGKLSKSTILNGFAALKTLADVIENPGGATANNYGGLQAACQELTGNYYSIIPHVFGRQRPTVINTMALLKRELELVDALGDMEVASKLISSGTQKDAQGHILNPIDAHFKSLNLVSMEPIERNSKEFEGLAAYTRDTHGHTHHFSVNVDYAFRVERDGETKRWTSAGYDKLGDGERMLLWHGSRTTNFAGILKQGLRIAPPEAPVTGYMFGKGVYFADMMSKSAGYCHPHMSDGTGVLLLCEVAVKPFHELQHSDYYADANCRNANKMATKGIGRTQPTAWQDAGEHLENEELKGVHMPKGKGSDVGTAASLQYNEYIVYDSTQIRIRYLLMVKMQ